MQGDLVKLFIPIMVLLALVTLSLIVLPLGGMLFSSSAGELIEAIGDSEVLSSILLTFEAALYATIGAVLLGTPLAYLLARFDFPGKKLFEAVIDIPIIVPHTAAGIALLSVFGSGAIGNMFSGLGLDFIGTKAGISLAMAFVSIPFYIDSVKDGLVSIDMRIDHVARSLGASRGQVFFHVLLPMSTRSMVTGALLMWGRGISEFGAVVILAYHPMIAPVLIYDRFTSYGLSSSRPVAVLLILGCIFLFMIIKIISRLGASRRA
jgi:molybdate/tungstate transport system permease protein